MSDFEIVPESMRDAQRQGGPGRHLGPLNAAIIAGETVFVPLNGSSPNAIRSRAARTVNFRGLRLCTHLIERDGVEGMVLWAEPKAGA